jgi:signal transduction histidine kinase
MEGMIDSTLEFLRGGVSSEVARPLDLVSMIETIVDHQVDQGKRITLAAPGHGRVLGKALALKRAFWNIIGNAAKYAGRAHVEIGETPSHLVITVDDDGPGIPEPDLERVFEPFVRLEQSRGRETGGSGLGLTIARAVILGHGGDIALSNRPEGGLRVSLTLPRLEPALPQQAGKPGAAAAPHAPRAPRGA